MEYTLLALYITNYFLILAYIMALIQIEMADQILSKCSFNVFITYMYKYTVVGKLFFFLFFLLTGLPPFFFFFIKINIIFEVFSAGDSFEFILFVLFFFLVTIFYLQICFYKNNNLKILNYLNKHIFQNSDFVFPNNEDNLPNIDTYNLVFQVVCLIVFNFFSLFFFMDIILFMELFN